MAAARERLVDSSEKLRLAFSSLSAVNEEVVARTTGVDVLPLSEATAKRVSEAASMAKVEARKVLKAAEAAEAAAATAVGAVSAAQAAKSAAAAKSSAAKAAVEAVEAAKAVAEAAEAAAEAAKAEATAMESQLNPPVGKDRRTQSGDNSSGTGSGSMSSAGLQAENGDIMVHVKVGESDMSDEAEEEGCCTPQATRGEQHESSHNGDAVPASGCSNQETQEEAEATPGKDAGEEEDEEEEKQEQEEEHETKVRRGKRKLGATADHPRRSSVRAAGSRRPNYAESAPSEPSKRQRKTSEPGTGKRCRGGGVATVPKTSPPMVAGRNGDTHQMCQEQGCTTYASFGKNGSNKREFCKTHAKHGMVDVFHKRCGHQGCMKQPIYGVTGSKEAEFCKTHAKHGMVDVRNKRCGHPGCMKGPSYGETGSNKREFCKTHAKHGMVYVCHKRCGHQGCLKHPSYGETGSKKAEFCQTHAKRGMVRVYACMRNELHEGTAW